MPLRKEQRHAETLLKAFFTAENTSDQHRLDLSSCHLSEVPSLLDSLIRRYPTAAARLKLLNLAHNSLTTLPSCLDRLPNLQILFLLNNNFSAIPPVVARLESLFMLSFKQNALHGELNAAQLPPNLTWLILTSNRISSLSDDFPRRCSAVRKLMLANNCLSTLPSSFVDQMKQLQLIRLANNRFDTVPEKLFDLPKLTWVALGGNPAFPTPPNPHDLPKHLRVNLEQHYTVDWKHPFGSGASGTTYPAVHNATGERVAVKKFHTLAGSDGRALDEVFISLSSSGIPNLVSAVAYDLVCDGDIVVQLHLVMKLVEGNPHTIASPPSFQTCTTSVYDDSISLTLQEANTTVETVQKAARSLRQRSICHGDIYGHNVLIGRHGAKFFVTLADLGAAWAFPQHLAENVGKVEERALDIFRDEIMSLVRETQ